jgi:hypothetical protein
MPNKSREKDKDRERELQELKEKVKLLQQREREREYEQKEKERAANQPSASTAPSNFTDSGGLSADSIALRSTLRLLMLQRDRARRDIVALEELRDAALKEPIEFVEYIQSQKRGRVSRANSASSSSSDGGKKGNIFAGKEIPKPQDIYRCPPVEWSQYRILGAPLDALHDAQRRRPSPSRPTGTAPQGPAGVPPSMQTGGIIGMSAGGIGEYADSLGSEMQARMRLFDGIAQRGSVVGR